MMSAHCGQLAVELKSVGSALGRTAGLPDGSAARFALASGVPFFVPIRRAACPSVAPLASDQ